MLLKQTDFMKKTRPPSTCMSHFMRDIQTLLINDKLLSTHWWNLAVSFIEVK